MWPYQNNEEWLLHCTSPIPGVDGYDYLVELMAKQVRTLFGGVPGNLEEFAFASQAVQAEALKFFIELFRSQKWRRTGIIWWNLINGWPQFSTAVVDYYFEKKLAYDFIKRSQRPVCLMLKEPKKKEQELVVSNDTRKDVRVRYRLSDADTGKILAEGEKRATNNSVTILTRIPFRGDEKRFYLIDWEDSFGAGRNHYLSGIPPFDLSGYKRWLRKCGFIASSTSNKL